MRKTKKEKFEDQVWDELFKNKTIFKLGRDMASILCDVMDNLGLPSLDRKGNWTYMKTKEWAEVCESTKRYLVRTLENNTGTFLDREYKKARDCRKKNGCIKTR
jgi:hypothetical protein